MTFLHTADWQLGKPYARVADVTKRGRLQNERFECLLTSRSNLTPLATS